MKKLMITTMLLGSMAQNAFAQKIEIKPVGGINLS